MSASAPLFAGFNPALVPADVEAAYWLRQATLRLRREVAWRWHLQGVQPALEQALPPPPSPLAESLDLTRYVDAKRAFYDEDVTARWLSEQLAAPPPRRTAPSRGGFGWVCDAMGLDEAGRFVLGLALLAAYDAAAGAVIAACLSRAEPALPTLRLAQQLWERPDEILVIVDPHHPLWRSRLLSAEDSVGGWDQGLVLAPAVCRKLLAPATPLPPLFRPLAEDPGVIPATPVIAAVRDRLRAPTAGLRVLPLWAYPGADVEPTVRALAADEGRPVHRLDHAGGVWERPTELYGLLLLAWLNGSDLLLEAPTGGTEGLAAIFAAAPRLPLTLYLASDESQVTTAWPADLLLPTVTVPRLDYSERLAVWHQALGERADELGPALAECARRFRFGAATLRRLGRGLAMHRGRLGATELFAACRAEVPLSAGGLAQPVMPRFSPAELILPTAQQRQFEEVCAAMSALTRVHYEWGTARVWSDAGISVLFSGPPGTGKTMAAEVLARRLDLPMYRVDLSQVVNKYIGETEKNLKRVFDLADVSDTLLFFDEADALFGRRTEVKDSHDRYANLEVSYLLERMERFQGLSILATNQRRGLDDAFLRRLRYIIEFPPPDTPQREAIWRQSVPAAVDASGLDFGFLARQFPLTGGHIRSVVFNACLQTAHGEPAGHGIHPRLTMPRVLTALQREYAKLRRPLSAEQLGAYAAEVDYA